MRPPLRPPSGASNFHPLYLGSAVPMPPPYHRLPHSSAMPFKSVARPRVRSFVGWRWCLLWCHIFRARYERDRGRPREFSAAIEMGTDTHLWPIPSPSQSVSQLSGSDRRERTVRSVRNGPSVLFYHYRFSQLPPEQCLWRRKHSEPGPSIEEGQIVYIDSVTSICLPFKRRIPP